MARKGSRNEDVFGGEEGVWEWGCDRRWKMDGHKGAMRAQGRWHWQLPSQAIGIAAHLQRSHRKGTSKAQGCNLLAQGRQNRKRKILWKQQNMKHADRRSGSVAVAWSPMVWTWVHNWNIRWAQGCRPGTFSSSPNLLDLGVFHQNSTQIHHTHTHTKSHEMILDSWDLVLGSFHHTSRPIEEGTSWDINMLNWT